MSRATGPPDGAVPEELPTPRGPATLTNTNNHHHAAIGVPKFTGPRRGETTHGGGH